METYHIYNHGSIYERYKGWGLSPAYETNPTPIEIAPGVLTTSIDLYDHSASLQTAKRVADHFRLNKEEGLSIINEVGSAVKQWRFVATDLGRSK